MCNTLCIDRCGMHSLQFVWINFIHLCSLVIITWSQPVREYLCIHLCIFSNTNICILYWGVKKVPQKTKTIDCNNGLQACKVSINRFPFLILILHFFITQKTKKVQFNGGLNWYIMIAKIAAWATSRQLSYVHSLVHSINNKSNCKILISHFNI